MSYIKTPALHTINLKHFPKYAPPLGPSSGALPQAKTKVCWVSRCPGTIFPPLFHLPASYLLLKTGRLWLHFDPGSSKILVKCLNHLLYCCNVLSCILLKSLLMQLSYLLNCSHPNFLKQRPPILPYFVFYLKPISQM